MTIHRTIDPINLFSVHSREDSNDFATGSTLAA